MRFRFPEEFYLENQWKTARVVVSMTKSRKVLKPARKGEVTGPELAGTAKGDGTAGKMAIFPAVTVPRKVRVYPLKQSGPVRKVKKVTKSDENSHFPSLPVTFCPASGIRIPAPCSAISRNGDQKVTKVTKR